jgi:transmembrane sensor
MSRRAALRQAARWAMREDEAVLTERPPAAAADIQRVLDDPALGEALSEIAACGRLSDAEIRGMRAGRNRALGAGLATVLVAVVATGTWKAQWLQPEAASVQHFETARGEHRVVQLADGSRIELDGATSLDVRFDSGSRTVEMQRGEAYFDVAHAPDRPFVVRAGEASTRVLGTAFSVDIGQTSVKLAVYRGKVRFGGASGTNRGVVVPAGWRSSFAHGAAVTPTRFDGIRQDWRQSWVDTDAMVLGDLVEELNRRTGPTIGVPPAHLACLPLSGRFKLNDAEELLGAIGEVYGFRVLRDGDQLRLDAQSSDLELSQN